MALFNPSSQMGKVFRESRKMRMREMTSLMAITLNVLSSQVQVTTIKTRTGPTQQLREIMPDSVRDFKRRRAKALAN